MLGTWQLILPETFRYVVFGIFKIDTKPPSDQCVIPGNIIPGIPVRPLPPGFISGGGYHTAFLEKETRVLACGLAVLATKEARQV